MKVPNFSEFNFGYAITDNLVNRVLSGVKAVPLFPSLSEEGQPGVGYDVKIPRHSKPLFLQFKLPQVIPRHRNVWGHDLRPLYYRIHMTRSSHSSQHSSLVDLANGGKDVFYVAPAFHELRRLNAHYLQGNVPSESAFFRAEEIGHLTDERHHIAYKAGHPIAWICSEPRKLKTSSNGKNFVEWLNKTASAAPRIESADRFMEKLVHEVVSAATSGRRHVDAADVRSKAQESSNLPLDFSEPEQREIFRFVDQLSEKVGRRRAVGYAARMLLDTELIMVGNGDAI